MSTTLKTTAFALVLAVVAQVLLAGCASDSPALVPVGGSQGTSTAEVNGIAMQVDPVAWQGDRSVRELVIPLEITIENGSDRPLSFRYQDLSLLHPSLGRMAALPPFVSDDDGMGRIDPRFRSEDFAVASGYERYYSDRGVRVYDSRFDADPDFYRDRSAYWESRRPTDEMLEYALPEGVLEPGGSITGFVYFEPMELRAGDEVVLSADFVGPDDRGVVSRLGTLQLPFRFEP